MRAHSSNAPRPTDLWPTNLSATDLFPADSSPTVAGTAHSWPTVLCRIVAYLSVVLVLCLGVAARAQPAQPGDANWAAAAPARGVSVTVLAPTTAVVLAPTTAVNGAASGVGTMTVATPGDPQPHTGPIATPIATPSATQAGRPPARQVQGPAVQSLTLEAGTGRIVSLDAPAASVFAADPHVAEVRPASATSLFVLGVAPGRTTIAAIGDDGVAIAQYDVIVQPSTYAAGQAASAIAKLLPGRDVHVVARPNGLMVSGTLRTAGEADEAVQTARSFVGAGQTVESRLAVLESQQVNLRVRIAEMSRAVVRNLGVNWSALGNIGMIAKFSPFAALNLVANADPTLPIPNPNNPLNLGGNINGIIDALATDNLAHVLAEPNLTAMSGETASFLVGGEFPIPVAGGINQVTVEFKQYGISLAFVPTVESGDRINMKVRPEVSALTTVGAVQLSVGNSTIQVPALTVRRAETTVELASGQSFAIAGLLQDDTTLSGSALPGIGEVPILGALFRSDGFQRNETELVIVITPYLVRGVSDRSQVKLPTDDWKPPSDLERILLLRQSARGVQAAATPHIPGDAGFVVQ
jgi:pilus assembly protein CpaC